MADGAQAEDDKSSPLLQNERPSQQLEGSPRALPAQASPELTPRSLGSFSYRMREFREFAPPAALARQQTTTAATRAASQQSPRPPPAATFPRNVSVCQLAGGASEEESKQHKRVRGWVPCAAAVLAGSCLRFERRA